MHEDREMNYYYFFPETTFLESALCLIFSVQQFCFSGPCKNGGKCLEINKGYKCKCTHGFTGYNCEGKQMMIAVVVWATDIVMSSNPNGYIQAF